MSDDHAYQAISAYDDKLITTPNIDRLANEGILFTNACVTNSIRIEASSWKLSQHGWVLVDEHIRKFTFVGCPDILLDDHNWDCLWSL